jgi:uncharacterized protein YgiM (DUF1202 family)
MARPRGGAVSRMVLGAVIPFAAALVVAWGLRGLAAPPPATVGALGATSAAGPATAIAPENRFPTRSAASPPPPMAGVAAVPPATPSVARRAVSPVPVRSVVPTSVPAVPAPGRPTARPRATPTPTPTTAAASPCVPPSPLPPVEAVGPLTTTTDVNVRSGPGLDCDILRVLRPEVDVTARSGPVRADGRAWLLVELDGRTGWVAADFVREPIR